MEMMTEPGNEKKIAAADEEVFLEDEVQADVAAASGDSVTMKPDEDDDKKNVMISTTEKDNKDEIMQQEAGGSGGGDGAAAVPMAEREDDDEDMTASADDEAATNNNGKAQPHPSSDRTKKRKHEELDGVFINENDGSIQRSQHVDTPLDDDIIISSQSSAVGRDDAKIDFSASATIATTKRTATEDSNNSRVRKTKPFTNRRKVKTEDMDEREINMSKYDPACFFSSPTFPPEQLEQAQKRITAAIMNPLQKLEIGGIQLYLDHLRRKREAAIIAKTKTNESERIRKLLENATIPGDPRSYQRKLFEIAKSGNTIINLGTGFGKTLVALMCIKHFGSQQDFVDGKKQTLFLVPSVALAIQQSITLRANLPKYDVRTACYTSANSDSARTSLAKCNVIVATHGAILDLMMHYADMFQMSRFNLLVVDECHYATGNHAYSVIMNKFYHVLPKDDRPHVIGLTASPLVNVKETHSDEQLEGMLSNLEQTLDSTLVSATGLVSESNSDLMMKSADESVIDYHGTNVGRAIPSADNLELHSGRFREFKQLDHLYKELGPLVVGLYCDTLIRELSRNEFENESLQQFKTALKLLLDIKKFCEQQCLCNPNLSRTDKLLALEELLEVEIEDHPTVEAVGLVFVERRITAMALHNYFQYRNTELDKGEWVKGKELRKTTSPGMIPGVSILRNCGEDGQDDQFDDSIDDPFTAFHQPDTPARGGGETNPTQASANTSEESSPASYFDEDQFMDAEDDDLCLGSNFIFDGSKNFIRSSAIVRNATQIFKSLCSSRKSCTEKHELTADTSATWLHQETNVREMLTKLRRGEINLLFATSVVEEGVDVQACSFVAVFDALKNTKGYIQMKGRARQRDAKFFVFRDIDEGDSANLQLHVAQEMERRVQKFIETKTRTRLPEQVTTPEPDFPDADAVQNEAAALEAGCYTVAHGRVNVHSAKSLLNRYALSVPIDPFCRNSKESLFAHLPYFDEKNLILPSHLPSEIRVIILPKQYENVPKKERQKLLSLVACVRLHSHGLLNDRLLPLTRKDMQKHIFKLATQTLRQIPYTPASSTQYYSSGTFQGYIYPINQSSPAFDRIKHSLLGTGHRLALVCSEALGLSIPPITLRHSEFGAITASFGEISTASCNDEQVEVLSTLFVLLMNDRWSRRSRNMRFRLKEKDEFTGNVPPYTVGIIGEDGLLDWDFMKTLLAEADRSKSERIQAVLSSSHKSPLPAPRLWAPLYDERVPYIVYGPTGETCAAPFPHEKEGVNSYHDYFQRYRKHDVRIDSPLFEARRMWNKPSSLQCINSHSQTNGSNHPSSCKELASVKLAQEACLEPPLANAFVALLCSVLPQCLYIYERYMNTKAFINHCTSNFSVLGPLMEKIDIDNIANALTAKSCSLDSNYEKLEWFGDGVLKLVQTDSLIKSLELRNWIRFLHEGDLSALRSAMGSNIRLEKTCKHLQLDKFIMSTPLARGQWIPPTLEYAEGTELKRGDPLGPKVYADVMESVLGLLHVEFGYEVALEAADDLQLTLSRTDDFIDKSAQYKPNNVLLDAIRSCTEYGAFQFPELAEEAFTHPSANHPGVSSYQRLEWIGDAVLCVYIRDLIYKDFKHLSLGEMVVFEAALVSNETLAFLSVRNGLQQYLNHNDMGLPSRIESYCWNVQEHSNSLWSGDPPKTISDIVESIIGAVYLDGGYAAGQNAVKQIMSPLVNILLEATNENKVVRLKHPKKMIHEIGGEILELGSFLESDFATSTGKNIEVCNGGRWGKADAEGSLTVATVELCGATLVAVADPSAVVARNRACALVVNVLENNEELRLRLHSCRANIEKGLYLSCRKKSDAEDEEELIAETEAEP